MVNHQKVFWVGFAVAYTALLIYGLAYQKPGAFPSLFWVVAYLGLAGMWAALAAVVLVGCVWVAMHSGRIAAAIRERLESAANWFTK